MIADYDQGGLRVPDADSILKSQKIMWIKRYFCSRPHPWKSIFRKELNILGGDEILLNQSLDILSIKRSSDLSPSFKDILCAWGEYVEKDVSQTNIMNQQIFFNKYFKTPTGYCIFYKDLLRKGIRYIRDIIRDGAVMTIQDMMRAKDLTSIESMNYLSIRLCIKNEVRTLIQNVETQEDTSIENLTFLLERENSKIICQKLINKKFERATSEEKVIEMFDINLSENDWATIYSIPFFATIEVKLRSFQISLNHFYFFTNEKLFTIGRSETNKCYFCENEIETIIHLFVECPYVVPLWRQIETLLEKLEFRHQLNDFTKIFGFYQSTYATNFEIANHILMTAKHHIHMCKYKKTIPTVASLMKSISDTEYLERQIALSKNKILSHEKKWRNYLD